MKILRIATAIAAVLGFGVAGVFVYFDRVANPRVERELLEFPNGERAQKVMLVELPSGRRIPVNYLREGDRVFAGADGRWWMELQGEARAVRVWVRGETLNGRARAVRDDPDYTRAVFKRLRPNAIPGFGTLVEIQLDPPTLPPG
jgi:hypothetical protein